MHTTGIWRMMSGWSASNRLAASTTRTEGRALTEQGGGSPLCFLLLPSLLDPEQQRIAELQAQVAQL
jgi:hypothetical protein